MVDILAPSAATILLLGRRGIMVCEVEASPKSMGTARRGFGAEIFLPEVLEPESCVAVAKS